MDTSDAPTMAIQRNYDDNIRAYTYANHPECTWLWRIDAPDVDVSRAATELKQLLGGESVVVVLDDGAEVRQQ